MTSFGLKLLAMFSMIFDHVGFMFMQNNDLLYYSFRTIGRLAFPIFAFQLAIGYSHSKNKEKHIVRMLIFAVLSQLPYFIYVQTAIPGIEHLLNIGFTFLLALLGMYAIDKNDTIISKIFSLAIVLILSYVLPVDYGIFGVLLCLTFYIFKDHKYLNLLSSALIIITKVIIEKNMVKYAMIYALLPIYLYNGKKGLDNKFSKYLFYIFYPAHLLLFAVIKMIV